MYLFHIPVVSSSKKLNIFVFYSLQSGDSSPPDKPRESDPPSPQSDLYTPPVEDIQVTDIFYEDTESSTSAGTVSAAAAAVLAGQILLEELFSFFGTVVYQKHLWLALRAVPGRNLSS